jgi:uroporphyrinogen III methyltransferase/synthase
VTPVTGSGGAPPPGLGTVYLVGAGPGDPGLLTCRGRELLESCDCLIHDYLVNPLILAMAPETAAVHDVGKRGGSASITQEEINARLIALSARHQRIVRLKGGDPFLFGRGGEEAAALADAGVRFEVVPGVTSGTGVPAYAGIPITHRAASSAVAFVTGHRQAGEEHELDWSSFARIETLVLYMGMHRLAENCAALIRHGRSPDTPACAIQWGSYPQQRVVVGTIRTLPELVRSQRLGAPAITVIGDVVNYRERIRWFDHPRLRPLFGKRVLVTRAREQSSTLVSGLRALGAEVIEAPLTSFSAQVAPSPFDAALTDLARFSWIAFTSANAVRFLWERLLLAGRDARALSCCRLAVIGDATAHALTEHGLRADLVSQRADAASLAQALMHSGAAGTILLPQADNAKPTLERELRAGGWSVTAVTAYRALAKPLAINASEPLHAVTFASSGTVERFAAATGAEGLRLLTSQGCRFIAIGPQTAATMSAMGIPVSATAEHASVESLVACVASELAAGTTPEQARS